MALGGPGERVIEPPAGDGCHTDRAGRGQGDARLLEVVDRRVLPARAAEAASVDFAIGFTADVQRGVITREQLLACGLSAAAVDSRVRRGWLRVLYRGVYAVGHVALPALARETAAILACGQAALLSHRSATELWGLTAPRLEGEARVDVTVIGHNPGRRRGIEIHRTASLDSRDMRRHMDLPVLGPARALLDVAPQLTTRELERALEEGLTTGVVREAELVGALARHPRRRGSRALGQMVRAARDPAITRSEAEERFLTLTTRARLSPPEVNVRVGPYIVDSSGVPTM